MKAKVQAQQTQETKQFCNGSWLEFGKKNEKIEKGNGDKMNKGIVKWFSCKKGYGFIAGVDGTDIFVHFSGILMNGFKTLREGQAVTYDIDETGGKTSAINVCPE